MEMQSQLSGGIFTEPPRMLACFPVAAEMLTRLNLQNTPQIQHGSGGRMVIREGARAGLANVFCTRPYNISVSILGFVGHTVSLQLLSSAIGVLKQLLVNE